MMEVEIVSNLTDQTKDENIGLIISLCVVFFVSFASLFVFFFERMLVLFVIDLKKKKKFLI